MASKLGVVAKYADAGKKDAKIWVAVSDIITAEPVSGAEITAYNYQLQEIGSGKSDTQGLTAIDVSGRPFAVRVKKGESVTYIRVTDGEEMSLSRFDTGGEILHKGLKGFVYGERGVWRPGDTLHLNMILILLPLTSTLLRDSSLREKCAERRKTDSTHSRFRHRLTALPVSGTPT